MYGTIIFTIEILFSYIIPALNLRDNIWSIKEKTRKHTLINFFFFFSFLFYIKRVLANGNFFFLIPLVARPCKEDSRRNIDMGESPI